MRIRVFFVLMMVAFLFLIFNLMSEQVFHSSIYQTSSIRQSIRRVRMAGERGRIFDRNHVCLVDNRPNYCIAIYVNEIRVPGKWSNTVNRIEHVLDQVSLLTGLKRELSRDEIFDHIRKRLPLPMLAWRDITPRTMARLEESDIEMQGVDLHYEAVRTNLVGGIAAHVLGYVGRAEPPSDEDVVYHYHEPEMDGKNGLEKEYDSILAGEAGCELITVDASGFRRGQAREVASKPGSDIVLTLDMDIQRLVEDELKGMKGAAVILDPRNGDVLAMASSPSYDPNLFAPSVSRKEWARLVTDAEKPLVNRAIAGEYPPGSTFKPMVAIAALESGLADEGTSFTCDGHFNLGNVVFHCWQRSPGHRTIALRKALEQSCNSYFCQLGLRCDYPRIHSMAQAVGFGKRTGIDIEGERTGLLPDEAWKRRALKDGWRKGDTCNVSIGQGALTVTPLQMAVFTAALANGGYIYRPRLRMMPGVERGDLVKRIAWSPRKIEIVRSGMRDVIQADTGTGKRARIQGVEMAGKTGTAQYGARDSGKKHTWMLAFAPFEAPRYAAAVIVEDGESGGITVAPKMRKVMEGIFKTGTGTVEKVGTGGPG
jgi:penicillin-binding protein 2